MDMNILISLISVVGSAVGTVTGVIISNKLTLYRIEQLEKKIEKTDELEERITKLEIDKAIFIEKVDNINCKLDEINAALR